MKLLGFYLGLHDSNLSFYDGSVHYAKSERLFQKKHHRADVKWIQETCNRHDFIPDAIAFSDGNRNKLGICKDGRLSQNKLFADIGGKRVPMFCLDHHYAHMLSSWPVTKLIHADYGISIDGQGDHNIRVSIVKDPGKECATIIFKSSDYAFCQFFNSIGKRMKLVGQEIDFAGKIMGANAYGNVDKDFIATYSCPEVGKNPFDLFDKIKWRGLSPDEHLGAFYSFENSSFRDWLASVHLLVGEQILELFKRHIPLDATVVYAGGGAQNTVYNQVLKSLYKNLEIPPHCYDGGISLGCLEYLRMNYNLENFSAAGFPFWQDDDDGGYASTAVIKRVAAYIGEGKVVGWFQGKGEVGPRALGHRSILIDATLRNGKDHINSRIKKREFWRPFAPSVKESRYAEIFKDHVLSPYMLRAVEVREAFVDKIRAVVHVDGTSRAQTVNDEVFELQSYSELLSHVETETGFPLLLNTSFNSSLGPIVSSREQAMAFFKESEMDVLCVGDEIFTK